MLRKSFVSCHRVDAKIKVKAPRIVPEYAKYVGHITVRAVSIQVPEKRPPSLCMIPDITERDAKVVFFSPVVNLFIGLP
jgi:hypothetical protein